MVEHGYHSVTLSDFGGRRPLSSQAAGISVPNAMKPRIRNVHAGPTF